MSTFTITSDSTMEEILNAYPGAQRALFQRYHIGGCSSCGFQPSDTLAQVLATHGQPPADEVIKFIHEAGEMDKKIQISVAEVSDGLKAGELKLFDVRGPEEISYAKIEGSKQLSPDLVRQIMDTWPKDTQLVFYCHSGRRSMDVAAFFAGHGFTNVRSMQGGIDAWSQQVDNKVPRYQLAPMGRGAHLM